MPPMIQERIIDREVERKALINKLNSRPARIKLTRGHVAAIARAERLRAMSDRSGRKTA